MRWGSDHTVTLLSVTACTVWLEASAAVRIAILARAGYGAHALTPGLVRHSRDLHERYLEERRRGLPVPGWWQG